MNTERNRMIGQLLGTGILFLLTALMILLSGSIAKGGEYADDARAALAVAIAKQNSTEIEGLKERISTLEELIKQARCKDACPCGDTPNPSPSLSPSPARGPVGTTADGRYGFQLQPGETIVAIDGVPVGQVVGRSIRSPVQPIYSVPVPSMASSPVPVGVRWSNSGSGCQIINGRMVCPTR